MKLKARPGNGDVMMSRKVICNSYTSLVDFGLMTMEKEEMVHGQVGEISLMENPILGGNTRERF